MAELFDSVVESGYFQPFGGLSAEQEECKAFTAKHIDEILCARQREKYVKDVKVCCCGFGAADEDEPMDENNFSQFQFFAPYTNDLVFFVDKFDFIVKCVAHGVCKVHPGFEERYMKALLASLTFKHYYVPEKPEFVLDLRQPTTPRTIQEDTLCGVRSPEKQAKELQLYCALDHGFTNTIRAELKQLEQEQFEVEKARGEHISLMGWEEVDRATENEREAAKKRIENYEVIETANVGKVEAEKPSPVPPKTLEEEEEERKLLQEIKREEEEKKEKQQRLMKEAEEKKLKEEQGQQQQQQTEPGDVPVATSPKGLAEGDREQKEEERERKTSEKETLDDIPNDDDDAGTPGEF